MEIPVHIRGLPTWAALALSQFPVLPCCLGFPRGKKDACLSSQVIKPGLEHDLTGIQPGENCKVLPRDEALQPESRQCCALPLSLERKGVVKNPQKLLWEPGQHNTAHHMQFSVPPTGMEAQSPDSCKAKFNPLFALIFHVLGFAGLSGVRLQSGYPQHPHP